MNLLQAERRFDFSRVPMPCGSERAHDAAALRVMAGLSRLISAFRRANFDFGDNAALCVDDACTNEWQQRQVDSRRVAANAAHVACLAYLFTIEFRQTVNEFFEPHGSNVLRTVPAFVNVSIAQAEIRRTINDAAGESAKAFYLARSVAVRQRENQNVARLKGRERGKAHVITPSQIRVNALDVLPGVALGSDLTDLNFRVVKQEAKQFAADVTRPTGNCNSQHHTLLSTTSST